jgi:hypothetical protein
MSDVEKLSLVEIIAPFTYLYCHQVSLCLCLKPSMHMHAHMLLVEIKPLSLICIIIR